MKITQVQVIGAGIAAGALIYFAMRPKEVAQSVARAAVGTAAGAIEGAVVGFGEVIGIPETNQTACQKAKASGSAWDASFDCPAGDFISWMLNRGNL